MQMLNKNSHNNQSMEKRSKIISYLYLARAFESSLIGVTGAIELIMLGESNLQRLITIAIGAFFMMVGIYAWNDALDIKEDSISHPERPIPRGEITMGEAKTIGTSSFIIALLFFWFLGLNYIPLFLLGSLVGVFYSKTTKHITFGKTATVLTTAVIGAGSVAFVEKGNLSTTIIAFTLSIALLLLGYEIMKDMRDVSGDKVAGIRTIPMILGFSRATLVAGSSFVLSCLGIGAFFLSIGYLFEGIISILTGIIIIPAFIWLYHRHDNQIIDMVRLFAIGTIGLSLNVVAISIYIKQAL